MPQWDNNMIQYPRLLSAIEATQAIDYGSIAESMGLSASDVRELFVRARRTWEDIKDVESPVRYGTLGEDVSSILHSDDMVHHESYSTMTEVASGRLWVLAWYCLYDDEWPSLYGSIEYGTSEYVTPEYGTSEYVTPEYGTYTAPSRRDGVVKLTLVADNSQVEET